jgi:MipA family protein
MKRFMQSACFCTLGLILMASQAAAATMEEAREAPRWRFTGGGVAIIAPDYEGSDQYRVRMLPLIDLTYGRHFFIQTHRGIGWRWAPTHSNWDASGAVTYRFGRKESDNPALSGLGDIRGAAELVLTGSYSLAPWVLSADLRQQLDHQAGGMLVGLRGAWRIPGPGPKASMTLIPSITWANRNYMETRFQIDAGQALRSGYAPFQADAGIKDLGLAWQLRYPITPRVSLTTLIGYSRLLGDAAQSPIVRQEGSAHQVRGIMGIGYSFK